MSTTFAGGLKQRFAGQLSENEVILCSSLQRVFQAILSGQKSFKAEMVFLWAQLHKLRKFNFDVEAAVSSHEFDPAFELWSGLNQSPNSSLSPAERAFLGDALGLMDWVVRNGVRFTLVLEVLGHDIGEISHHEFSLEETLADGVLPKVNGWAKRNSEPVGEADDQN